MDPLAGGLSLLGGIIGNAWTDKRQEDAQAFAAAQSQAQMAFQERMSSSAYQRSMADMRAAGLNPILAYQKGPASSPTGAMASTSHHAASDIFSPAVSSAQHGRRLNHEIANMVATNANLAQDLQNKKMEEIRIGSTVSNINADTAIKREILEKSAADAAKGKTDQSFYESGWGKVMRTIGNTGQELGRVFHGSATGSDDGFGRTWNYRVGN